MKRNPTTEYHLTPDGKFLRLKLDLWNREIVKLKY